MLCLFCTATLLTTTTDNNNAWRLNSRAARVQLNLRQTLWNDKLGNVLVFERAENITALRDRARAHDKTLSG